MWNVELINGYWRVTKDSEPVGPYKFETKWQALEHMSIVAPEKDVEEIERMLRENDDSTPSDLLTKAAIEYKKSGNSKKCKLIMQEALYKATQHVAKPSAKLFNPEESEEKVNSTLKDLLREAIIEYEKNGNSKRCKSIVEEALYKELGARRKT
jgi:hypothetical protein